LSLWCVNGCIVAMEPISFSWSWFKIKVLNAYTGRVMPHTSTNFRGTSFAAAIGVLI
jgi:hypothetical protein